MMSDTDKHIISRYQDRKKLKWAGFYLSDHTAKLSLEKKERDFKWLPKERMELSEIDRNLYYARKKDIEVAIQLEITNLDGYYLPDIVGKIKGFDDIGIYIEEKRVEYDLIRNVELLYFHKWSEV